MKTERKTPAHTVTLTVEQLAMLVSALDAYEYWELSDINERNNGYSTIEDDDADEDMRRCRELQKRLGDLT